MVQLLERKKHQKTLIGILVIVVIITAFVWYSNYQKGPSVKELAPFNEQAAKDFLMIEKTLKEIELDFGILENSVFKVLKFHGVLPVVAGKTGRENPFAPY